MKLAFSVECPSCLAGRLEVGPSESYAPLISRRMVRCSCGRVWTVTATMVEARERKLDHCG